MNYEVMILSLKRLRKLNMASIILVHYTRVETIYKKKLKIVRSVGSEAFTPTPSSYFHACDHQMGIIWRTYSLYALMIDTYIICMCSLDFFFISPRQNLREKK